MWVSKAKWFLLEATNAKLNEELKTIQALNHERTLGLERMNSRLQSDLDWCKHRLNQVERERGQLIQAAIGVKISVPEFVPATDDTASAFNEMPDISTVGGDAKDDDVSEAEPNPGIDYTLMPGYGKNRIR